jgi:hypothetical protein
LLTLESSKRYNAALNSSLEVSNLTSTYVAVVEVRLGSRPLTVVSLNLDGVRSHGTSVLDSKGSGPGNSDVITTFKRGSDRRKSRSGSESDAQVLGGDGTTSIGAGDSEALATSGLVESNRGGSLESRLSSGNPVAVSAAELVGITSVGVIDLVSLSSNGLSVSRVELRVHTVPRDLDVTTVSACLNRSWDGVRSSGKDWSVGDSRSRAQSIASSNLSLNTISGLEVPGGKWVKRNITRVLLASDPIAEVVIVNVSGRAEVADGVVSTVLSLEVNFVSLEGWAVRVRSVPGESEAGASGAHLDLRCIGSTSRSPDLSGDTTKSTSIASSYSEFVRSSLAILVNGPRELSSLSSLLLLPVSTEQLSEGDGVSGSGLLVSTEVASVNWVPASSDFALRNFREVESSNGSSVRSDSEERSGHCGDGASLSVASISSCLDEVTGSQEERRSHEDAHFDSAGVSSLVELISSKGLVAVSVLINGSPLASDSNVVVLSADTHVVSINTDVSTSSVLGLSPGKDSIT